MSDLRARTALHALATSAVPTADRRSHSSTVVWHRNQQTGNSAALSADPYDGTVPGQTDTNAMTGRAGIFGRLGDIVVRKPWWVIGCWIVLAVALPPMFPSLVQLSQTKPAEMLPTYAPSSVAVQHMNEAFHESASQSISVVVLSDDNGLSSADEDAYRKVVDALHRDPDVVSIQDFISTPAVRDVMVSKDGKAWLLPVGVAGDLGSPQSYSEGKRLSQTVKDAVAGTHLTANVTGPLATLTDLTDIGARDQHMVEVAMVVMLLAILLIIYRNPLTMMLPLATVGLSLVVAQSAVAGLGVLGLSVSSQTIVFLSAIVAGAGTDYAVFLISRYHDYLRKGETSDQAVKGALASIGKVIAASAATVAVTFLVMVFTRLSVFSTVGVALAVAIGVCFLAGVTFLPAILVLAGRRGWISPGRDRTSRFWRRSGIRIVRRPWAHLAASLIVLIGLACTSLLAHYNYDDRKALPSSVDSAVGYEAMADHFPVNASFPQYLIVQSPGDLRTPQALADLEQMAQRVSQLPDIDSVRGITRPTGESLELARLSVQSSQVGSKLDNLSTQITDRSDDLNKLADGANKIADALGAVRVKLAQSISTVNDLVGKLSSVHDAAGNNQTLKQLDNNDALLGDIRSLGGNIDVNLDDVSDSFSWAGAVLETLNASPVCEPDPACNDARHQLQQLANASQDGSLNKIAQLARQLKDTENTQDIRVVADNLRSAVNAANAGLQSLGLGNPAGLKSQLNGLQQSANLMADGSRAVSDGVQQLVDQTKKMGTGLSDASAFLLNMKNEASAPSMSGFYIPQQIMTTNDFQQAAANFISADGHTARYVVQSKFNPFSAHAADQVTRMLDTAREAQPNTTLANASISMAGFPPALRDTRGYYAGDMRLIVLATIVVVVLILMALLRAVVAPLYLIVSVVLSYLSALGIGVLVFQVLLGQELHWSVPGLTFILLVAVGADYNMLLISRVREESLNGIRMGVIRTVGQTGGVITAAGLIFAASMLAMVFASIGTLVQCGFVIGVGVLLDTFVVRTITVPAVVVLMGKKNWWPSLPPTLVAGQPEAIQPPPDIDPSSEADEPPPDIVPTSEADEPPPRIVDGNRGQSGQILLHHGTGVIVQTVSRIRFRRQ